MGLVEFGLKCNILNGVDLLLRGADYVGPLFCENPVIVVFS